MAEWMLDREITVRVAAFAAAFAALAVAEWLKPRRALSVPKRVRWTNNLALTVVNSAILRALFPAAAVGAALLAERHGLGLLRLYDLPLAVAIVVSVLLLDLAVYLQHVLFHAVPALWRLHRVHHADLDFDVTTGFRFHPVEMVLSMLIKFAAIAALGAPAPGVLIFELLLSTTSLFNHANLALPHALDRTLRIMLVTPDMHRVHHSVLPNETNSNFGFNLSWWDRLFGTYHAQPAAGHEQMTLGVAQFRTERDLWLDRMLLQPFQSDAGGYSVSRRPESAQVHRTPA